MAPRQARGEPWPYPRHRSMHNVLYTIQSDSVKFEVPSKCDIISNAIERFKHILKLYEVYVKEEMLLPKSRSYYNHNGTIRVIRLRMGDHCDNGEFPVFGMNESCEYHICLETA